MKKILFLALLFACTLAFANESKWVEMQCIDIPAGATVHESTGRPGNTKYWFEFDLIGKISISSSSAEKYKAGKVTLQLVKWYNKETKEYRYTIRQKKDHKETKNIDLLTIFQQ